MFNQKLLAPLFTALAVLVSFSTGFGQQNRTKIFEAGGFKFETQENGTISCLGNWQVDIGVKGSTTDILIADSLVIITGRKHKPGGGFTPIVTCLCLKDGGLKWQNAITVEYYQECLFADSPFIAGETLYTVEPNCSALRFYRLRSYNLQTGAAVATTEIKSFPGPDFHWPEKFTITGADSNGASVRLDMTLEVGDTTWVVNQKFWWLK